MEKKQNLVIISIVSIVAIIGILLMTISSYSVNNYRYNNVGYSSAVAEENSMSAAPSGRGGSGGPKTTITQCNDHLDNDGDGYCDANYKGAYCSDGAILGDSGCSGKSDNDEYTPVIINYCIDGILNNGESDVDCGGTCNDCSNNKLCNSDSDCLSTYCDSSSGTCQDRPFYLDPRCSVLQSTDMVVNQHINLVFVPSGFNGDMVTFAAKAKWVYSEFYKHKPFDQSITQLNAFYVTVEGGNYCYYNCSGIDRLLCCDNAKATNLSGVCTTGKRQTIVIHNDVKYGGAGGSIATTSINSQAPQVAVHEVGHSLFKLGDEYTYQGYSSPTNSRNCDSAGCTKWSMMLGYNSVNCVAGCANGAYFTSENTIMRELGRTFEEVNLRASCCAYGLETGKYPPYCDQFQQFGDLNKFCGLTTATFVSTSAPPGTEYVINPVEYNLIKNGNSWTLESVTSKRSGYYSEELLNGDSDSGISINLENSRGKLKDLTFSSSVNAEYPSEDMKSFGGYVSQERTAITFVVDEHAGIPKGIIVAGQKIANIPKKQ